MCRWFRIYFPRAAFLGIAANLALIVVTVESIDPRHVDFRNLLALPRLILYPAVAYVGLTIWRFILFVRTRSARDAEFRRSVCQIFQWLYAEMFGDEPDRRFTLFVRDPLDPESIIPKVRFRLGHPEHVAEFKSKARYRSGEGSTGRAWEHPRRLIYTELPKFSNRAAFDAYYVNDLKIAEDIVAHLSDFMVRVQAIYSYGFVDHLGNLLGVVSIDVQGEAEKLDLDPAETMVRALSPVLEAFA
jgi:hypothetical protein